MSQHNTLEIADKKRRRFLMGSALFVGGAVSGSIWAANKKQTPDYQNAAYESWVSSAKGVRSDSDYIVLCASLAPSPHNTQPWKFSAQSDSIKVFADKERNLGAADHEFRQMQIGLGCAIYNIDIASRYLGYEPQVRYMGTEQFERDGLVAIVDLRQTNKGITDEQFATIFSRSTNRAEYDMAIPVSAALLDSITSEWDGVSVELYKHDSLAGKHILRSVRVGARNLIKNSAHFQDGIKWWRYTREELVTKRDGISIHTGGAPFFVKEGMEHFVDQKVWSGDFGRNGEINWVDGIAQSTPVWGVIHAKDDGLVSRMTAGMMLEKAYLQTAFHGFHINPIGYPIEDAKSRVRLAQALNISESRQLMAVFRLGKGPLLEKSVRRDLSAVKV